MSSGEKETQQGGAWVSPFCLQASGGLREFISVADEWLIDKRLGEIRCWVPGLGHLLVIETCSPAVPLQLFKPLFLLLWNRDLCARENSHKPCAYHARGIQGQPLPHIQLDRPRVATSNLLSWSRCWLLSAVLGSQMSCEGGSWAPRLRSEDHTSSRFPAAPLFSPHHKCREPTAGLMLCDKRSPLSLKEVAVIRTEENVARPFTKFAETLSLPKNS